MRTRYFSVHTLFAPYSNTQRLNRVGQNIHTKYAGERKDSPLSSTEMKSKYHFLRFLFFGPWSAQKSSHDVVSRRARMARPSRPARLCNHDTIQNTQHQAFASKETKKNESICSLTPLRPRSRGGERGSEGMVQ